MDGVCDLLDQLPDAHRGLVEDLLKALAEERDGESNKQEFLHDEGKLSDRDPCEPDRQLMITMTWGEFKEYMSSF